MKPNQNQFSRKYMGRLQPAVGALVAALLMIFAVPAAADISPEEFEAFERHVERSGTLLREGEFGAGIDELEQAIEIIDHPRIAMRIAQAYEDWGRCDRAGQEYQALLERDDIDDQMRAGISENVEGLGDCTEMAPLEIACEPEGAELRIEGDGFEQEGACPFFEEVAAGDYQVEIWAQGFESWSDQISVRPMEGASLEIRLEEPMIVEELEDDVDGMHWSSPVSFGAMGVGVLMLAGGGILDYQAGSRAVQLAEARDDGDLARVDELESSAASARVANIGLYAGGALFLAGGLALYFLDFSPSDDIDGGLSLGISPTGISATLNW